jgi:hypothetical protein
LFCFLFYTYSDIEADQLANAQLDGRAIKPASIGVRRRAAMELGLRPFFHGGVVSALCVRFQVFLFFLLKKSENSR